VAPANTPPPNAIILDSMADGVFTVDLEQRITFFNRAAQEITGVPREAALGRPCSEVLVQLAALREALNRVGVAMIARQMESCFREEGAAGMEPGDRSERLKEAVDMLLKFS